ncbi:M16 family metallopeptidase [Acidobacteriota bacterium]
MVHHRTFINLFWLYAGLALVAAVTAHAGAETFVEKNGLRLVSVSSPRQSRLHLHVLITAGSSMDRDDRSGVAWLTGMAVARGGTKSLSAREVDRALSRLDINLNQWVDREFFHLSLSLPSRNLYQTSRLLADILFNPALDEEALKNAKAEKKKTQGREQPDPSSELAAVFFRDLPFVHPVRPSEERLSAVTLEDIIRFHRERYVPANTIIAFTGPLQSNRVVREFRASMFGFAGESESAKPSARFEPWGLMTLAFHETKPGRSAVLAGMPGPGPDAEGWQDWISSFYAMADPLRVSLEREGLRPSREAWLRAGYLAGGRIMFEIALEVDSEHARKAAAILRREIPKAREITDASDRRRRPAGSSGRTNVPVKDVLMRYCIDQAMGQPEEISAAWVEAASLADPQAWKSLLMPATD